MSDLAWITVYYGLLYMDMEYCILWITDTWTWITVYIMDY